MSSVLITKEKQKKEQAPTTSTIMIQYETIQLANIRNIHSTKKSKTLSIEFFDNTKQKTFRFKTTLDCCDEWIRLSIAHRLYYYKYNKEELKELIEEYEGYKREEDEA